MARSPSVLSELRAAEKKFGKFESLDLLIPDLSGILRGKRIRRGEIEKCARGGFVFCAGSTLLNSLGQVTTGVPYGADDGRNAGDTTARKIVRGGSWRDRPHRAREWRGTNRTHRW